MDTLKAQNEPARKLNSPCLGKIFQITLGIAIVFTVYSLIEGSSALWVQRCRSTTPEPAASAGVASAVRVDSVEDLEVRPQHVLQSILWIVGPYYGWTLDSIQGFCCGPCQNVDVGCTSFALTRNIAQSSKWVCSIRANQKYQPERT